MADQQPVERILLRQLAAYLTIPMWMMDEAGNLLYFNPAAEVLLGAGFDEIGPIRAEQLPDLFSVASIDERADDEAVLPVQTTLETRRPSYGAVRFRGLDEAWRQVEIAAIPIEGQSDRFLGVLAFFWEIHD